MFKLKMSSKQIENAFAQITHKTFTQGSGSHWHETQNGYVDAESVCWMFCWAATGQQSPAAMQAARDLFDAAFADFNYADFESKVGYDWAKEHRYDSDSDSALKSKLQLPN